MLASWYRGTGLGLGVCKLCCKLSMSVVMMLGRGRGGAMFQLVPGYGSGLEGEG